MSLVTELRRRNVFRVVAAYLVVGWLLTEVLTTILPTLGAPEWAARAVILIFAFGFVPSVVLSWVYEWTPEGLKREKDIDRAEYEENPRARVLDYVTISAIALVIVFIGFFSASRSPDRSSTSNSIAVLPFDNMSESNEYDYFSDGLTEQVLHLLAQIPDLKVAARTSSFEFKDKNVDIREIAESLGVAHVLEGSVQLAGKQVRVYAQLIRAEDGYHVWSQRYDRTLDNIFEIQDDIAASVGAELSRSLLGVDASKVLVGVDTQNADAYQLYLQALAELETYSYGGLRASEELLKAALTIDPDFYDAKTELATTYLHQYETGMLRADDAFAAVLAITAQVLAERPNNAAARALQLFAQAAPYSLERSPETLEQAVAALRDLVDEHPDEYGARVLLSRLLSGLKRDEEALELQLDALENDPLNARIHYEVGSQYLNLGRFDEARAAFDESLGIEPLQPNVYLRLARAALADNDAVGALQSQIKAMEIDPRDHEIPGSIAGLLYQLGLVEEGDDFADRVMAIAPTSEMAYRVELLRAIATADEEAGVAVARRAIEDDIDDRQFAYGGAVQYLLRLAARDGRVDEEVAWLEAQAPGMLDIDASLIPVKYRVAQTVAFDAWYTTLPADEIDRRVARMRSVLVGYGFDPLDDPRSVVAILAMRGETEQAIDVAVEDVFSQPVVLNLNWKNAYDQPQYAVFSADDRVQAAMRDWRDDEQTLKEQVRSFLIGLSAAS